MNDLWMVVSDQIDQIDSDCQWPSQKGDTGGLQAWPCMG